MPRNYKSKVGARVYTVTAHETLRKAFEEYQNGSSQRVVCAKLKYSITRFRIQNFIKEKSSIHNSSTTQNLKKSCKKWRALL